MSENKLKQGTPRVQERNREENYGQKINRANSSYEQYQEDYAPPGQPYPGISSSYIGDNPNTYQSQPYQQSQLYGQDNQWNYQSRMQRERTYGPQQHNGHNNYEQNPYESGQREFYNDPEQTRYGNYRQNPAQYGAPYQQQYRNNPNRRMHQGQMQQQYEAQQDFNNYNPGQWNEGSYRNQQALQYGQPASYSPVNNYGGAQNPAHDESSFRINEQGALYNNMKNSGKGPKGYHRSDERIKEDISDRMFEDPYLDASNIEVGVENNEVVLNGTVGHRDAKRRAEEIAESISGVANIENRLRINKETMNEHKPYASSSATENKNKRNAYAS